MQVTMPRSPAAVPETRARARTAAVAAAPIALVTAAGAVLRLWSFDRVGANPFYDAAVRSMSQSWHNLLFGALDPGGQVSVDKVPADLWLQVATVKLLGFSGVAMRLPEALASVAAIPLLADLVRRGFGRAAALGAAAALAVLPTAILTAHSDTMDSVMMALDVAAAWLIVVAAQRRRVWPVVAAGAAIGLAFDVKLFEALIALPALALLLVLTVAGPPRRRVPAAGAATGAMVVVGLAWIAVASLTPLAHRPWPFGSANGSIWNVIFAYNGVDRIGGPASAAARRLDPPGALRLFSSHGHDYLATAGTMLLAAIALGVAALAASARRRAGAGGPAAACALFFAAWLVTGVGLLSHMQRMQPRYLEAVTPAVAAVVGIAVAVLAGGDRRSRALLAAGCAVTVALATALSRPPAWATALALACAAGCAMAAAAPRLGRRRPAVLAVCSLAAVLAVPGATALTVARQHRSDAGLPSRISQRDLVKLSAFLAANTRTLPYEVASASASRAAPLIARDGRPVLMLTSAGGRPLLTPARLAGIVAAGRVRFGLLPAGACPALGASACAPAVRWALRHGRDVSAAAGLPRGTLYRLGSA
jgi:4-amino-4-deoxy-L-arabinose transferase-like glycosyltransferase